MKLVPHSVAPFSEAEISGAKVTCADQNNPRDDIGLTAFLSGPTKNSEPVCSLYVLHVILGNG